MGLKCPGAIFKGGSPLSFVQAGSLGESYWNLVNMGVSVLNGDEFLGLNIYIVDRF